MAHRYASGKKTVFPTLSRYTTPTPTNPASLTKQEQAKSQVKTKRFHTGLSPLYAPTVPLAPHPCVRWWNTKEITLKLTRLCLHSLRGGSTHQKTIPPRGGGCPHPPRRSPKKHHPGGVNTNEQGAVFHPLNGSGAKGTTGRSNAGRRKQEGYPKVFYPRDNQAGLGLYPVVP